VVAITARVTPKLQDLAAAMQTKNAETIAKVLDYPEAMDDVLYLFRLMRGRWKHHQKPEVRAANEAWAKVKAAKIVPGGNG
jgi:hypothetical protein